MTRRLILSAALLLTALPLAAAPIPKHLMKTRPLAEAVQGDWQLTARLEDGIPSAAELIQNRTMVVGDGTYTLKNAGNEFLTLKFKLDSARQPHHIDITDPNLNCLGILKLEGDVLTLCFGRAGEARPTEFDSPKGTGQILATYTRVG